MLEQRLIFTFYCQSSRHLTVRNASGENKWGPSPSTILQIYKQCVRPIFEYGIVSTITVLESVINKIQRVQNSFIRLALRLPKYVSTCLLHEASGLPYVREKLISVGQNHLARMHVNPLIEHTISSARTNIAWDKYKTMACRFNQKQKNLVFPEKPGFHKKNPVFQNQSRNQVFQLEIPSFSK